MTRDEKTARTINVAVAVIQRADGGVLLAERPRGKPMSGYWEFPGGKFEPGEDSHQALAREVYEELGLVIDAAFPWLTREFAYAKKVVRLHFYRVVAWHGDVHGREGQRIAWENPAALTVRPLLPANYKVISALCLPTIYAISNAHKHGVADFIPRLLRALERGVRLIQIREPGMDADSRREFAHAAVTMAHAHGARVLINGDVALAQESGADGVHLQGAQLMSLRERPDASFWSASCHDAAELARAAALEADFVVLSQILPSATHPEVGGMGWERFGVLAHDYPLPIFALGGMRPEHLETAMRYGAHGIALLSAIW